MRAVATLLLALAPASALAQVDQATRACLLLRPASDCLSTRALPFLAPGDALSLAVLKPPTPPRVRATSAPTYYGGELSAELVLDDDRQIVSIPLSWTPVSALSVGVTVPLVHQALETGDRFTIGDLGFGASAGWGNERLSLRAIGSVKVPTGDPEAGTGSGAVDGMAFGDVWVYLGDLALNASGGYRRNGGEAFGDLVQESAGVEYTFDLGADVFALGVQARAFAHQILDPNARQSVHGVVALLPRFWSVGFGYAAIFFPLDGSEDGADRVVFSVGLSAPFGRAPLVARAPEAPPVAEAPTPVAEAPPPAIPSISTATIASPSALGARLWPAPDGLLVTDVAPRSPAARLGVAIGDHVRTVAGARVDSEAALVEALERRGGAKVPMELRTPTGPRVVLLEFPVEAVRTSTSS